MKSKLAVFVILFGWFITISYIVYDYNLHGNDRLKHPFIPQTTTERFFHVVILFTFFGTHITGYLINERRKLLVKTLQSAEKLTRILHEWTTTIDSMPYGVMLIDREFNIIRANKYIAELSRVSLKELRFKKCYEVIHKTDKPVDGCPLMKLIEIQSKASFEYYNPCYNKSFIATVTPIFDDNGAVIAYSHPLIDITDTKQKEVKLIESKSAFFNMLKDVDTAYKKLRRLYHNLIIAFANVIDAKSPWTKGHSERVTNYAVSIAKEMVLSEKDIDALRTASFLHDIGKIGT